MMLTILSGATSDSFRIGRVRPSLYATSVLGCALLLLSACSSGVVDAQDAGSGDAIGARGGIQGSGKKLTSPTPVSSPITVATAPATYDTSIGLGVDANGFADLSLRAGAHRYFVNSAKGSDNNSCSAAQSPSTPMASGKAAMACTTDGEGDQLLFAEGTTYATTIPGMQFRKGGYSLAYPFVLQSYDPADPLNEAKYGRATGNNRPVFTGNTAGVPWVFGGTGQRFLAVRGFDINPGNIPGQSIGLLYAGDGILFENNLLRYTAIGMGTNSSTTTAHHWILRGNAIYGTWDDTAATAGSGIYVEGTDSLTIEDNVLYHNGWKIGANRTDSIANGGATLFRHAIYQQLSADAVVRRNLIIDGSADGGSFRGNITHSENVIIDCPIAVAVGGGTDYYGPRPNGVSINSSYNAIIGSATVPGSGAGGWAISSQNGKLGSSAHHNLILMSGMASSAGVHAFLTSAAYNVPSYMDYSNNLVFQWSSSGQTREESSAFPSQTFATYNNNIWDDLTSGTNISNAGRSYPNAYTPAQLYAALGFADKQAFANYAISHPEAFPARSARTLLFAGYGL